MPVALLDNLQITFIKNNLIIFGLFPLFNLCLKTLLSMSQSKFNLLDKEYKVSSASRKVFSLAIK